MTFTAGQLAAIAAANKTVYWYFTVTESDSTAHYWSTGNIAAGGSAETWDVAHTFAIINFSGITMRRTQAENGIVSPNDVTFSILNKDSTLAASDFKGGTVHIRLVIDPGTGRVSIRSWKFKIRSAAGFNQQIDLTCVDFLQEKLKGTYPNTRLISDIFPSSDASKDDLCVPEPYGTCYVPIRSVLSLAERYYVLGPTGLSYSITAVRSPRSLGAKIEWMGLSYTMSTSSITAEDATTWAGLQPLIVSGACGFWLNGSAFLDMPCHFSRSDTATTTNPADIINAVLLNMGVAAGDIDATSFAAAHTVFDGWGLAWNFAFYYKQDREAVLANLLAMCHSSLVINEKIEIKVLSKTSAKTITTAEVMRTDVAGPPAFQSTGVVEDDVSDSGYVAYQEADESQDEFIKLLVTAKTTKAAADNEILELPGVQDDQIVQALGTLYYQRKLLRESEITATLKGTCLTLSPDEVVTFSGADFGGTAVALIDSMTINPDVSIAATCTKYSVSLDDYGDLAPTGVTVVTDTTSTGGFRPVVAGVKVIGGDATPFEAGLYANGSYFGWWDGSIWRSYIKNDGDFGFIQSEDNVIDNPTAAMITSSANLVDFTAANLIDNDTATKGFGCPTDTNPGYITIDLGANNPRCYGEVRMYAGAYSYVLGYWPQWWHAQYSDDGSTWTFVRNTAFVAFFDDDGGWASFKFGNSGFHRYWRIVLLNFTGTGPDVMEMDWYTAGSYIKYEDSQLTMMVTKMTVSSSQGIHVRGGGDITLETSDLINPSMLIFDGTDHSVTHASTSAGDIHYVAPSDEEAVSIFKGYLPGVGADPADMMTGGSIYKFLVLGAAACEILNISYNASDDDEYAFVSQTYEGLFVSTDSTRSKGMWMDFTAAAFLSEDDKSLDVGAALQAWGIMYADTFTDVADYPYFDEIDDLAAIRKIQPRMKDGEYVRDAVTQHVLIDDDTLPDCLIFKHRRDIVPRIREDKIRKTSKYLEGCKAGDVARDSLGRPYIPLKNGLALAWGACKQLDMKHEEVAKQVADLLQRVNDMEKKGELPDAKTT